MLKYTVFRLHVTFMKAMIYLRKPLKLVHVLTVRLFTLVLTYIV